MKQVLFVCNHNAGRSQMAQAFFERPAPDGGELASQHAVITDIRRGLAALQPALSA